MRFSVKLTVRRKLPILRPMSKLPTVKEWLEKELEDPEWVGQGGRDQEMMLEFWKEHRPKMYRALKQANLHKMLAQYLENREMEQFHRMRQQMPPTDAREQAQRDWYLMEEEAPDTSPEQAEAELEQLALRNLPMQET